MFSISVYRATVWVAFIIGDLMFCVTECIKYPDGALAVYRPDFYGLKLGSHTFKIFKIHAFVYLYMFGLHIIRRVVVF